MTLQALAGAPKSSFASLEHQWIADADDVLNVSACNGNERQKLQSEREEISDLPGIRRELRMRRNACTLAADGLEPPDTGMQYYKRQHLIAWLRLSHVCHRFRDIVLGTAGLWAKHVLTYLRPWTRREILRRSQGSILDLTICSPDSKKRKGDSGSALEDSSDDDCEAADTSLFVSGLLRTERVRSLRIWTYQSDSATLDGWLETLSRQLLPLLQMLVIKAYFPWNPPLDHVHKLVAPNLHTLLLRNIFMSWNCPSLRCLSLIRELDCYQSQISQSCFPPANELLALLAASPQLEELCLVHCLPKIPPALEDDNSPISLPRLSQIHIKGTLLTSFWLWRSLDVPRTCTTVSIIIDYAYDFQVPSLDIECLRLFFLSLRRDIGGAGESERFLHTVVYLDGGDECFTCVAMGFGDRDAASDPECSIDLSVPCRSGARIHFKFTGWGSTGGAGTQPDIFKTAAESFSFRGAKTLKIGLRRRIYHIRDVHHLYVGALYATLFDALVLPTSAPDELGWPPLPLLPALESIHIKYLYRHDIPVFDSELDTLRIMLSFRQRFNASIKCLRVGDTYARSPVDEAVVRAQVQDLVPTLVWGDRSGRGFNFDGHEERR
ncbi:hypothetical protein OF83DRAFT_1179059 [Amylostereum chailletii]|nr:hypothetical protein OF83DRAFT_1179059 [Amylostereum chailletii]